MITIKSEEELEKMRVAGQIVARILEELARAVKPGISTLDLDRKAEKLAIEKGTLPAFKGYSGYRHSICASVNEAVVHGIPNKRPLCEGDIVGIDFGVIYEDFYSDSALTLSVGKTSEEADRLMRVTREALYFGIEQAWSGNHVHDISHAIQKHLEGANYSVVRELVGHGIGRRLHEEPQVPNYGQLGKGARLQAGMVLAIEPMANLGGPAVRFLADGWTVVTRDGSLSAHFEHTVAITKEGPEVLSLRSEEKGWARKRR